MSTRQRNPRSHQPRNETTLTPKNLSQVEAILARLPGMERQVLDRKFGLTGGHPTSRADIGVALNLTEREVAEIEKRGLARLRATVDEPTLVKLLTRLSG